MSREVKRVPLDFDWPLRRPWWGYLLPETLCEKSCVACDASGYSPHAQRMHAEWYYGVGFDPTSTGSTPLTEDSPEVWAFAKRNVSSAPAYYGDDEQAIRHEARRLARDCFNSWSHHLSQDDVDALVEGGRLMDFTHTWTKNDGWVPIEPRPVVLAADINRWSIGGFGHDGINCSVVIRSRCEREGVPVLCNLCEGHGVVEQHAGQRAAAEAWTRTEPPVGEGWQMWETVSEGSPISPVVETPEQLAAWLAANTPETYEQWLEMIRAGHSVGSGVITGDGRALSGVEAVSEL